MKSVEFGAYLKALREDKGIPQRKVAHAVDVDTSTLSKMELGERPITISMVKPWAETLDINFQDIQVKYICTKIKIDFDGQPYLKEALKRIINEIK
ncbi:helix-turn-helix domain-containing protein [Saccharicrinis sp. 156]|uniref:helix-turn-helix domain-containing protein n=1 Tax=Saccharicrinis sp. 156 TaxID=3417574 RepID=UPI003D3394BC